MVALPNQGNLLIPIDWQGSVDMETMNAAGGYVMHVTNGWRPETETAQLSWVLSPSEAKAMLDTFRADHFLGVYDYNCNVRGPIRIQLTGQYSFTETRNPRRGYVTASVRLA